MVDKDSGKGEKENQQRRESRSAELKRCPHFASEANGGETTLRLARRKILRAR